MYEATDISLASSGICSSPFVHFVSESRSHSIACVGLALFVSESRSHSIACAGLTLFVSESTSHLVARAGLDGAILPDLALVFVLELRLHEIL